MRKTIYKDRHNFFTHHILYPLLAKSFPTLYNHRCRPYKISRAAKQRLLRSLGVAEPAIEPQPHGERRSARIKTKTTAGDVSSTCSETENNNEELLEGEETKSCFAYFFKETYHHIAPRLQAFTPISPELVTALKEKVPRELKLTRSCPGLCFADPRFFVQTSVTDRCYNRASEAHEEPIFRQVLEQEKQGQLPDVDLINIDELGTVLLARGRFEKGTVLMSYQGEIMPAAFAPSKGEDGYDKLVTILQSRQCVARDICISPYAKGNLCQFASSCSPVDRDWRNMNAMLVFKEIRLNDEYDSHAVIPFLIAVKTIQPGTAITWFYGDRYDFASIPTVFTQEAIQCLVDEHLSKE